MKAESPRQRVKELFSEAVERPPEQRDSFLQAACGEDTDLREHVERLLSALEGEPDFLESPPPTTTDLGPDTTELLSNGKADLVGAQVSRYHLRRVIARGGMGAVYEAVQQKPHRTVAVKVMRRGIASKSALRRFEYESQILARLRHPGIAQVYEAGTWGAEGGVPYFVMEYVPNALPITEYVKQKKLSPTRRLELFSVVCAAVHHGHQRGIIHRDLKPANILIDSGGNPKVIDFGVARATDSDMAVTTLQTEVGQLIGTLQYMSPEQCQADPHDLDTRSDVYALGVVLYELLCEQLPYDVTHAPVPEAVRVVREESPAKPSTINRTLRGDVETILLKTLEKERERRYQSAAELAGDITRYLHHEPIVARPPSVGYQLLMFARRNKAVFGAMAAAVVVLVVAAVVSLMFAVNAMQEATARGIAEQQALTAKENAEDRQEEAETVTELLQKMLSTAEPHRIKGPDYTVRNLLDEFSLLVREQLVGQPEVEATIRATLGNAYDSLGEYDKAETNLQAALDIRKRIFGKEHPLVAESLADYAWQLHRQEDWGASAAMLEEALAMQRKLLGEEHEDLARTLHYLGDLKQHLGEEAVALSLVEEALGMQRRILGEEHPDTLFTMFALAGVHYQQDHLAEAEPLLLQTLESQRRVLGEGHPDTLKTMNLFCDLYREQGRPNEAESLALETLEISRRVLGKEHPRTLESMRNLGQLYRAQRRYNEAEALLQEAAEIGRRALGEQNQETLWAMEQLAWLYSDQGRYDDAKSLFLETLAIRKRALGEEHLDTIDTMSQLALAYQGMGKLDLAEPLFVESLELGRRHLGLDHPWVSIYMRRLGWMYAEQGRYGEAEPLLREALDVSRRVLGDDHRSTLISKSNLALLLVDLGNAVEAEQLAGETVLAARQTLGAEDWWHYGNFLGKHGRALAALQRFDDAESALLEAHGILQTALGDEHDRTRRVEGYLADLYDAWGKPDKAAEWRAKLGED